MAVAFDGNQGFFRLLCENRGRATGRRMQSGRSPLKNQGPQAVGDLSQFNCQLSRAGGRTEIRKSDLFQSFNDSGV